MNRGRVPGRDREARQACNETRALLSKRVNPRVRRKEECLAAHLADENTFGVVFDHRIKTGKESTHAKIVRAFKKNILPFLEE
jgi:hypothetical protein